MNEFRMLELVFALEYVKKCGDYCGYQRDLVGGNKKAQDYVYADIKQGIQQALDFSKATDGFKTSAEKAAWSLLHLEKEPQMDLSSLAGELRTIYEAFLSDMYKQKFLQVPIARVVYVDNPTLFGETVASAFPAATVDICEAGNCLAADCNTAAVFHAMRVAERGLKWLGKRLRVKLRDNKKELPITEAEWHRIIQGIQNKIKASRGAVKSAKRREQLEQYSRAADHCDYMREIWRNAVSHAHRSYNALEADSAVSRVRDFMQFLVAMK